MIEDCDWEEVPLEERPNPRFPILGGTRIINKRWRDLDFHGDFRFYGSRRPGDWHEYLARFTHGALESIVVMPEAFYAQVNVSAGQEQVMSIETLAARAYADRVTDGVESKLTLGRKLNDLIAQLPEDRRKRFKERASALIAEETAWLARRLED